MSTTSGTRPRPRGARLPRSQRRAQLLEAAQQLFVEEGYHASAMDSIAERAGVSKPVLYQHFPSKMELYLALLDEHTSDLVDLIRAAMASTPENKNRVEATIAAYFEFVEREGAPFRLVFESDLTNDPAVAQRVDSITTVCSEAIAKVIAEDTDLPLVQCELLGVALSGMAHICARYWLVQRLAIPRPEAAALVTALAWRGLGGFPKTDDRSRETAQRSSAMSTLAPRKD